MMWNQIKTLTLVQIRNLWNINSVIYSKDKKKKQNHLLLGVVWIVLAIMFTFYTGAMAYGYITMGLADIVPIYMFAMTSIIILLFSFFKAGSVIFQIKTYDMLISLPVSKASIVISRFLTMYVGNFVLGLLTMVPGTIIYGYFVNPSISFYIMSAIGIVLLPLLPMTIATAIGAIITGISSRMKHKSLVATALSMLGLIGVFILSAQTSSLENFNEEMFKNLSLIITEQINNIYPPAFWFGQGAVTGNVSLFLAFVGISIGIFILTVFLVQIKFSEICTALNSTSTKNNYKMEELKEASILKALYQRELKRYLASSIYVINTVVGYVIMVMSAIALFIMGIDKLEQMMQMQGIIEKFAPFILAAMAAITTTTSSSISLEGKEWWIVKSMPIQTKDIFNSKILVNLTIAIPAYIISVILFCLTIKTTLMGYILLILVPLVYILFISVVGITVNVKMPVFDWENETSVVKQGASTMVTMLIGFISVIVPVVFVIMLNGIVANIVTLIVAVVILSVTFVLYNKNNKVDLRSIE